MTRYYTLDGVEGAEEPLEVADVLECVGCGGAICISSLYRLLLVRVRLLLLLVLSPELVLVLVSMLVASLFFWTFCTHSGQVELRRSHSSTHCIL